MIARGRHVVAEVGDLPVDLADASGTLAQADHPAAGPEAGLAVPDRLLRPSSCGSKRVGFAVEADGAHEPPMVELVKGPQDERIAVGGRRFESDEHVIAGSMDAGGS